MLIPIYIKVEKVEVLNLKAYRKVKYVSNIQIDLHPSRLTSITDIEYFFCSHLNQQTTLIWSVLKEKGGVLKFR